jgi:hypothetical protein
MPQKKHEAKIIIKSTRLVPSTVTEPDTNQGTITIQNSNFPNGEEITRAEFFRTLEKASKPRQSHKE